MEHTLVIKKIIAGGNGLGTLANGMVAMVPGVLPGETVRIRETKAYRGHIQAQLVRVIAAAPERVVPPCPYYGTCGGCDLQHASYSAQLLLKQRILQETLERAHLQLPEQQPGNTLASPDSLGYRYRLRLHLDQTGRLGFHRAASNEVVPIRRCLLATDVINRVIEQLSETNWPQRLCRHVSSLELIHCPEKNDVALILQQRPNIAFPGRNALIEALKGLAGQVTIHAPHRGRGSDRNSPPALLAQQFACRGRTYRLEWDHRCFFQVNIKQNVRMLELALHHLPFPSPPFTALDLFCGMGNFSLPLGLLNAQVTGVEHNRHSISWAEHNKNLAGLENARFIAEDVERHLRQRVANREHFDCILFDPPREGLGKAAALLPLLQPRRIIAISCDPATLARDLRLIADNGYRVVEITPVDMFPQTHHIESVVILERI